MRKPMKIPPTPSVVFFFNKMKKKYFSNRYHFLPFQKTCCLSLEKAQGDHIHVYKYPTGGIKKTEPDSLQ